MDKFTSLHNHSHTSFDGLSQPYQMAHRAIECGFTSLALTDHGTVSGVIEFASALKTACKNCGHPEKSHDKNTKICLIKNSNCKGYEQAKLKPIFGNELYICEKSAKIKDQENRKLSHLCVLARNLNGWKNLLKITSESNKKDNYYYNPRLSLDELAPMTGDIIAFSGHPGSCMANILFSEPKMSYRAKSETEAQMMLKANWEEEANKLAGKYREIFGSNFFLEIKIIVKNNLPCEITIAKCLRKISLNLNIPCIATGDAHYAFKEQAIDHRILLCSELDTTFDDARKKIEANDDFGMSGFFKSNNYYIPSLKDVVDVGNTSEEINNAFEVSEMCEAFSIENKPFLPQFSENSSDEIYEKCCSKLTELNLIENNDYVRRFQKEMVVINDANLSDYLLIVQDYVNWAEKNNIPTGPGRGSAAGCLIAFLLGITKIDPIKNDLIFERFYNDGRNTKDKTSLPDIDCDFSKKHRKKVISYIKDKYGIDKVCGIATFNRMKGRSALKAVFSAYGKISFDQMNEITNLIPDPSKISGELQETIEEFGEASIIDYAIRHESKLKEYCKYDEHDNLVGPLSKEFEQAIRLENTKTHMGQHAAGIIISSVNLDDKCPMVLNSSEEFQVCGFEMADAEKAGLVKFDILGIAALDKIKAVKDLLETGCMEGVEID